MENQVVKIFNQEEIQRAIARIASEIVEKNKGTKNLLLVGVSEKGADMANTIARKIEEQENGTTVAVGRIDIKFYNEDHSANADPIINGVNISVDVNSKIVVLIDDIIISGRTAHSAINSIYDLGHPKRVQIAVLIDNINRRTLPIKSTYFGKIVETSKNEIIDVQWHGVSISNRPKNIEH